jgi:hypothetical protein
MDSSSDYVIRPVAFFRAAQPLVVFLIGITAEEAYDACLQYTGTRPGID